MQLKNIRRKLNSKFDEWVETIDDEKVKAAVKENTIITGGCITSMLLNENVNDYDVYFRDKETVKLVAMYYIKQHIDSDNGRVPVLKEDDTGQFRIRVQSSGIAGDDEELDKIGIDIENMESEEEATEGITFIKPKKKDEKKYQVKVITSNAITLTNKIQVIVRFFGEPKEVHENFDFVHCTNYWESKSKKLYLKKKALECILTKRLVYVGSKFPLSSGIRTRKFVKKGWYIDAGQFVKIMFQVSNLDLTDIKVLEDQLIGVDTLYFQQLIEWLKQKASKEPGFKITEPYVIKLINRLFK